MIEYRRYKRTCFDVLVNLTPTVYFQGDPTPYLVTNLSFKGLFIKGQTKYKRGEVLDIELEIPAIGRIPMSIGVVWVDHSESKGMGVEILEIPEEYRKVWSCFIKACYNLLEAQEEYQKVQSRSK